MDAQTLKAHRVTEEREVDLGRGIQRMGEGRFSGSSGRTHDQGVGHRGAYITHEGPVVGAREDRFT